ncbi:MULTISPECIES: amino acid ABC transporter substrate-binding protein [unclassified Beijerinckia]|uniref:amino acid ABC transporter substrate-binding protein n=1 Tax=unclassified Beijerinckia TaxID=2638183 RepID=UPI00089BEC11|nr:MULTISPECIES: amino acid ABC transporter substrate-binding protein [unclassified Beijerinckia]MDH7798789.1 ABC-type branched-subunit amino acid transport system substrate-binding protein [Beijerinckia sp. GAS462]SED33283.1 amino acid/amide ABC transporter substrate-binding protein, HAAT family [Beijerinckia sp. 28-YEA-48]
MRGRDIVGATRRFMLAAGLATGATLATMAVQAQAQTPSGPPIRIGSTLALTGPLAQTGAIHKIVGDLFVAQLNAKGGLLGRPVEWVLLDDQSKPDITRTLYERLITVDKVDLIIGPYATAGILSAMAVAQRYNKVLVHSTFGIPKLATYDRQFPAWPLGIDPEKTMPNDLFDTLASIGKTPKTIAIVTSKFPSVQFVAVGAREAAKARNIKEALYLEFEFGTRDFGPIAARVREADPDLLFVGAIGLEGNQLLEALDKLNYKPRNHFYVYPTPGPLATSPLGNDAMATTAFENLPPLNQNPDAAAFAKLFTEAATKAGLPYTEPETQAGASWSMWEILTGAVKATKSLDDKVLADQIKKNGSDTVLGHISFDGQNNYGKNLMRTKQVQQGKWVIVWPKDMITPGYTAQGK